MMSSPPSSMTRRVMSPCIGICKLDQKSGLLPIGCRRTIDEIGRWAMLDDPERVRPSSTSCRHGRSDH
jgi:predicted Fe-S protein YdhL (DUF1289 family)